MAYPRVDKIEAQWLGRRGVGGARFFRHQLGRVWTMDVSPSGHVTLSEAAILLGRHEDTVRGWIESGTVLPHHVYPYVGEDGTQTTVLTVAVVREIYRRLYGQYPNQ